VEYILPLSKISTDINVLFDKLLGEASGEYCKQRSSVLIYASIRTNIDLICANATFTSKFAEVPEFADSDAKDMLREIRNRAWYAFTVYPTMSNIWTKRDWVRVLYEATKDVEDVLDLVSAHASSRIAKLFFLNIARAATGTLWAAILAVLFARTWAPYVRLYEKTQEELQETHEQIQKLEVENQEIQQEVQIQIQESQDFLTALPSPKLDEREDSWSDTSSVASWKSVAVPDAGEPCVTFRNDVGLTIMDSTETFAFLVGSEMPCRFADLVHKMDHKFQRSLKDGSCSFDEKYSIVLRIEHGAGNVIEYTTKAVVRSILRVLRDDDGDAEDRGSHLVFCLALQKVRERVVKNSAKRRAKRSGGGVLKGDDQQRQLQTQREVLRIALVLAKAREIGQEEPMISPRLDTESIRSLSKFPVADLERLLRSEDVEKL